MTYREAAALTGLNHSVIFRAVKRGELESLFPADVEAWLERRGLAQALASFRGEAPVEHVKLPVGRRVGVAERRKRAVKVSGKRQKEQEIRAAILRGRRGLAPYYAVVARVTHLSERTIRAAHRTGALPWLTIEGVRAWLETKVECYREAGKYWGREVLYRGALMAWNDAMGEGEGALDLRWVVEVPDQGEPISYRRAWA